MANWMKDNRGDLLRLTVLVSSAVLMYAIGGGR